MAYLEKLREKYQEKRNECDENQQKFFDSFLSDDYCFLRIKITKALQIIAFLGIPQDEVNDFYKKIFMEMLKTSKNNHNDYSKKEQ